MHIVKIIIILFQPVDHVIVNSENKATGVALKDGTEIHAKVVLSNATPKVTFIDLVEKVCPAY